MTFLKELQTIESRYEQSPYVKEICITTDRVAVVVPEMDLVRARRIVNIGDLLRFEIEGQSVYLPEEQRVLEYEIWFEPLPRTAVGELNRAEITRRVRQKRDETRSGLRQAIAHDWSDDVHALGVATVIAQRSIAGAVHPDANLEIDLGFDSISRVELIAELERRLGVRIPAAHIHQILTVAQLIEALRPGAVSVGASARVEEACWPRMLRELPSDSDPLVSSLLAGRRVMPLMLFAALRLLRIFLPRVIVSGLQHLPARGPYIIAPNHQSYLDPFFLCSALPYPVFKQLFLVGASEYFESPLTAWLARQFNLVSVDPDANLVSALKAGAFGLSKGKILVIFPEGERSIDGGVKRFKRGASILARCSGVPIVPVAIHGVFELWPRNRSFNWRLLLPGVRHRIRLTFGTPLTITNELTDAQAAAMLRERVAAIWHEQNHVGTLLEVPR